MSKKEVFPHWMRKFITKIDISEKKSDSHLSKILDLLSKKPNQKVIVLCEGEPYQVSLDSNKQIVVSKC